VRRGLLRVSVSLLAVVACASRESPDADTTRTPVAAKRPAVIPANIPDSSLDQYWLRYRFPETGTFVFSNRIGSDTAYAYQLRLISAVATAATRPIGRKATIELPGRARDRIAIAPEALAAGLGDSAIARRHAVRPGLYRVLLVRDSVYVVCSLPCTNPSRVVLKDGIRTTVTIAPSPK
jgi:hypothetical protein